MKFLMFSIKDVVTGEFSSPRLAHNDADCVRQFRSLTSKLDNASDYQLYHIGIFDTELGVCSRLVDSDSKVSLDNVFVLSGEKVG